MTYGIPQNLIPLTEDGRVKTKNHLEFLQMRRLGEEMALAQSAVETVDLPLASDVLLGKGRPIQGHAGNLRLQAIVDTYVEKYCKLESKLEKTTLAGDIVIWVKGASGRFLSKESGIWREVPDDVARDKVSHLFRNRRLLSNKNPPQQKLKSEETGSPFPAMEMRMDSNASPPGEVLEYEKVPAASLGGSCDRNKRMKRH